MNQNNVKYKDYTKKGRQKTFIKLCLISLGIIFLAVGIFFTIKINLENQNNNNNESSVNNQKNDKKIFYLTLNGNGITDFTETLSCTTKSNSCKIKLPNIKRENWTFKGWAIDRNSKKEDYLAKDKITLTSNLTLYAITTKDLTLSIVNEENKNPDILSCTVYNLENDCVITLPNIDCNKNKVRGWSDNKDKNDLLYTSNQEITINENKTLYEVTAKELKVNLLGNDKVKINTLSCTLEPNNDTCKVTLPLIKKEGYQIIGWSNVNNTTNALYKEKEEINVKENITLYPVTKKDVVYKFYNNGAKVSAGEVKCTLYNNDQSCTLTLPKIERNGWEILGFGENKNSTKVYVPGMEIKTNASKNLYAITRKELKISFSDNNKIIGNSSCYLYNEDRSCNIESPKVSKSGYQFLGWSNTKNGTNPVYTNDINISNDTTIYAITKKTVIVTFNMNGADRIDFSRQTCDLYNNQSSCKILIPNVDKQGYISYGFNKTTNSNNEFPEYISNTYANFNDSVVLYADFNKNTYNFRSVDTYSQNKYNKAVIEVQRGCNNENINHMVNKISRNWESLFAYNVKISFLTPETFNSLYENDEVNAITFGIKEGPKTFIDISCDAEDFVVVHELIHNFDIEYKAKYGGYLSFSNELIAIYDKYKMLNERPLRDYSYSTAKEFLAELGMYYYKTKFDYSSDDFPDDMKNFVEKYLFNVYI